LSQAMSKSSDGHIDELVKAKWLALGLSQADLAEVLGAAPALKKADGSDGVELARVMHLADALGISPDLFNGHANRARRTKQEPSPARDESLQSLLELRLLRVFRELQDNNTKRMLIELTEQIVRRQACRRGDAG
jgi:transcriptional regulator with XRE-family HTH domain